MQMSLVAFMVATLFIKPRMNDTTLAGAQEYLQMLFFSVYFMYRPPSSPPYASPSPGGVCESLRIIHSLTSREPYTTLQGVCCVASAVLHIQGARLLDCD